jgi:Asp/Glu/hydantoin racemase
MPHLLLINPNTNARTTAMMTAVARAHAAPGVTVEGLTAPRGAALITTPQACRVAHDVVAALAPEVAARRADGVIVAAFGDPGLGPLTEALPVPVVGIAQAAMARAARNGPFAIVTTTPDLVAHIEALARAYGHEAAFLGVHLTPGDPETITADPPRLAEALAGAAREAVEEGARSIVVGGGPLAEAARAIAATCAVPVVEPVPEAVRALAARLARQDAP